VADTVAQDTGASWQPTVIHVPDNAVLRGWCFTPPHSSGAAVILLHGVVDTRQGVLGHARFLLRHGFTALTPDARGHGESGGEPISYGLRESDDVHCWATWLCQRQQVDRLYGLGESMGAAILLQSLRVEQRFRAWSPSARSSPSKRSPTTACASTGVESRSRLAAGAAGILLRSHDPRSRSRPSIACRRGTLDHSACPAHPRHRRQQHSAASFARTPSAGCGALGSAGRHPRDGAGGGAASLRGKVVAWFSR